MLRKSKLSKEKGDVAYHLVLASGALETEDDLLGRLGLLVEDGLGLSSVTCSNSKGPKLSFRLPTSRPFDWH